MMTLRPGGVVIMCDERSPTPAGRLHACLKMIPIDFRLRGDITALIDAARNSGWRAYAERRRRDLCPDHRNAARRRMTLIQDGRAR